MDVATMLHEQYPLVETLIIAALILLITWAAEHIVFRIIERVGHSASNPLPASSIFANIARICIWLAGIAAMFKICFNYDVTAFVAALGVGGIAISLGFQDTLLNLIGGLQVSIGKLVEPGEYIEVLGQRGRVVDVSWRHTAIVDFDGKTHLIPNSLMNKNSLVDIGEWGSARVPFLVPLDTDVDVFTNDVILAVRENLGESIGSSGVNVRFLGEEYGGLKGAVSVALLRCDYSPEEATDVVARAIDSVLKSAGRPIS